MKRKNFNFLSRTIMGLAVGAAAWGFSAFTADKSSVFADACFAYNGEDDPDNSEATNVADYSSIMGTPNCLPERETLCGICFDTDQFPLVGGKPNFADPVLASLVNNNKSNSSLHGSTITDPVSGKSIRLYFRERQ